jgi:hypothetical protein
MFERKCVKKTYPVVGCEKWEDEIARKSCLVHVFNKNAPKTWQLFDIEDFNEGWFHTRSYVNDVVHSVKISDEKIKN